MPERSMVIGTPAPSSSARSPTTDVTCVTFLVREVPSYRKLGGVFNFRDVGGRASSRAPSDGRDEEREAVEQTPIDWSPGDGAVARSLVRGREDLEAPLGEELERLSDEELAGRARSGDPVPFEMLWRRHADAGRRVANRFTSASDPDDIVQEAYLRIFSSLGRGRGPDGPFRPYLYQTIRNIAITWSRQQTSSLELLADRSDGTDLSESVLEGTITATAYRSLPVRWQEVLWYTEVEGLEPADIAPLLGLSASAVSALSYRAREGLRRAWLQAHVSATALPEECRWPTERMGEANRDALSRKNRERFDLHVEGCSRCTLVLEEVDEASRRLGLVIAPLLVGVPWATLQGGTTTTVVGVAVGSPTPSPHGWGGRWSALSSGVRSGYRVSTRAVAVLVVFLVAISAAVVLAWGALRDTHAEIIGGAGKAASPFPEPARPDGPSGPDPLEESSSDVEAGAVDDVPLLPPADPIDPLPPTAEPTGPPTTSPNTTPPEGMPETESKSEGMPGLPDEGVPAQPSAPEEPSTPDDPDGPRAPTLTGPSILTPLTTFPALSGTADPGALVVMSTVAGDELTTARADAQGAWSALVCTGATSDAPVCSSDGESLAVVARVLDEQSGLVSDVSSALTWTFERPDVMLSDPAGGPLVSGDIRVELMGSAGELVQVIIDGVPTGRYHLMPQSAELVWRDVAPGVHTVGVRFVTVEDEGAEKVVTSFGPVRTSTVTVE